jgi:hypothetical protein
MISDETVQAFMERASGDYVPIERTLGKTFILDRFSHHSWHGHCYVITEGRTCSTRESFWTIIAIHPDLVFYSPEFALMCTNCRTHARIVLRGSKVFSIEARCGSGECGRITP